MTPLQILDRLAFCIGYVVIGGGLLVACIGAVLFLLDWLIVILGNSIGRDNERDQND